MNMTDYLKDVSAFERKINRGFLHSRSKELIDLGDHIKEFAPVWDEDSLITLRVLFDNWLLQDDEVDFRLGNGDRNQANTVIKDFEEEIAEEERRVKNRISMHDPPQHAYSVWFEGDREDTIRKLRMAEGADVSAREGYLKRGAAGVNKVAQPGIGVAQTATHSIGLGTVVTGAAGAAGATGIGLLVGGSALAVVSSGLAVRSAVRTNRHLSGLQFIYDHRGELSCEDPRHDIIADQVLPYIIFQKSKKLGRKEFSAIPVIGGLQGLRGAMRKVQKWSHGNLGARRETAAKWLAAHLLETKCPLPQVIAKELFAGSGKAGHPDLKLEREEKDDGTYEMYALRYGEYDKVWELLARKMKST
jgi:hypothetical protein